MAEKETEVLVEPPSPAQPLHSPITKQSTSVSARGVARGVQGVRGVRCGGRRREVLSCTRRAQNPGDAPGISAYSIPYNFVAAMNQVFATQKLTWRHCVTYGIDKQPKPVSETE